MAGPRTRDVLAGLTSASLSSADFPWLTAQEITVAGRSVRALRVNYVGELGWELHVRMADVVAVYEAVWKAGAASGIADFGLYAMNSLRIEKSYAGLGAELTNEITPVEANMLRFVKLDHDFRGRAAVERVQAAGATTHLVTVRVDAVDYDIRGGEPVFAGDRVIGVTTSGGYGHATGLSLGFAYVDSGFDAVGTKLEIMLLGERRAAEVIPASVYDPSNARLKA